MRFLLSIKECSKVEIVLVLVPTLIIIRPCVAQVGLQTRRKECPRNDWAGGTSNAFQNCALEKIIHFFTCARNNELKDFSFSTVFFFFFESQHQPLSDSDSPSLNWWVRCFTKGFRKGINAAGLRSCCRYFFWKGLYVADSSFLLVFFSLCRLWLKAIGHALSIYSLRLPL